MAKNTTSKNTSKTSNKAAKAKATKAKATKAKASKSKAPKVTEAKQVAITKKAIAALAAAFEIPTKAVEEIVHKMKADKLTAASPRAERLAFKRVIRLILAEHDMSVDNGTAADIRNDVFAAGTVTEAKAA